MTAAFESPEYISEEFYAKKGFDLLVLFLANTEDASYQVRTYLCGNR